MLEKEGVYRISASLAGRAKPLQLANIRKSVYKAHHLQRVEGERKSGSMVGNCTSEFQQ